MTVSLSLCETQYHSNLQLSASDEFFTVFFFFLQSSIYLLGKNYHILCKEIEKKIMVIQCFFLREGVLIVLYTGNGAKSV